MSEKDKFTIPEPLETVVDGVKWKRFCCSFKSPEGKFTFHIYALGQDHALMLLEDLKNTATLDGEMISSWNEDDDPEDD